MAQASEKIHMEIAHKVYLVTGGASGLGAGAVRMLVAQGAQVVIADLQEKAGAALAQELGQCYVHCDVTLEADGQRAITAAKALGPLFGLINCAGVASAARIVGKHGVHPLDLFQKTVAVNLVGSFNMMRLAAEAMCQNAPEPTGERGILINTASVAAFDGQIGQAAYAASKAGIVGMTLPIARDLAHLGIRCMTIAPGIFATPMLFNMPQPVQDALAASVPFPARLGLPQDYAKLVYSMITNEMLNGETIRLDGAIRMPPK
jgi:NAD(P)-dependent dehydrogenase (short-subunit alcohol dehydrogenase family)